MSDKPSERASCPRCGIIRVVKASRPGSAGLCRDCKDCLNKHERLAWAA